MSVASAKEQSSFCHLDNLKNNIDNYKIKLEMVYVFGNLYREYSSKVKEIINTDNFFLEHLAKIKKELTKIIFKAVLFPVLSANKEINPKENIQSFGEIIVAPAVLAYFLDFFIDELNVFWKEDVGKVCSKLVIDVYENQECSIPEGLLSIVSLLKPGVENLKKQGINLETAKWWINQSAMTYEHGKEVVKSWEKNDEDAVLHASLHNTGLLMVASSLYLLEAVNCDSNKEVEKYNIGDFSDTFLNFVFICEQAIRVVDDVSDKDEDKEQGNPNISTVFEEGRVSQNKWPSHSFKWLQDNVSSKEILSEIYVLEQRIKGELSFQEKSLLVYILNIVKPALEISPYI